MQRVVIIYRLRAKNISAFIVMYYSNVIGYHLQHIKDNYHIVGALKELPYHVYYTERNNGVLSEHGSSKFQCQFHPSLLRGESFHSQNTHVTFP